MTAQTSPYSIIIRRGPSKRTAIIGWNRKNDTFKVGQWIKGKILDADISPSGKYWIYTAMGSKNYNTWTAVAKAPYLKALDFYLTKGYWQTYGRFVSNTEYFFGNSFKKINFIEQRKSGLFSLSPERPDLWQELKITKNKWAKLNASWDSPSYVKNINSKWNLMMIFRRHRGHKEYFLENTNGEDRVFMSDWEWADVDKGRILWSEKGLIMSGIVAKEGLTKSAILYDTNSMKFEELIAPY